MKKKFLTIIMNLSMIFGLSTFAACDVVEDLDRILEVGDLKEAITDLEDKLESMESYIEKIEIENATLKFEATFPNGLVTESCVLNNVDIKRSVEDASAGAYCVKAEGEGVEVTINGGRYDAGSENDYNIAIWAHHSARVVINGGSFITCDGQNSLIYAAGGSTIEINGGYFEIKGDSKYMLNLQDNSNSSIIVKGGTFVNFDPSHTNTEPDVEFTNFVAEGYSVVKTTEDGVDYYTVVKTPIEVEVEQ